MCKWKKWTSDKSSSKTEALYLRNHIYLLIGSGQTPSPALLFFFFKIFISMQKFQWHCTSCPTHTLVSFYRLGKSVFYHRSVYAINWHSVETNFVSQQKSEGNIKNNWCCQWKRHRQHVYDFCWIHFVLSHGHNATGNTTQIHNYKRIIYNNFQNIPSNGSLLNPASCYTRVKHIIFIRELHNHVVWLDEY